MREYSGGFDVNMTNCSFTRLGDFTGCMIVGHVKWAWPGEGDKWAKPHTTKLTPQASLEFSSAPTQQTTEYPKGSLKFGEIKLDQSAGQIPRGTLLFKSLRFHTGCLLDFRKNELTDDVKLKIEDCKMGHILLEGTDCTQINFYNNHWPKLKGRTVVGDEYQIGKLKSDYGIETRKPIEYNPKPSLIRRTYQQLAKRFKENLDHPVSVEFDRGAFEMRRKETKAKGEDRDLIAYVGLTLYKIVSYYSGRLDLPVFWLLVTIFGFGWLYFIFTDGQNLTLNPFDVNWEYMGQYFKDTLKVISFGKPEVTVLKESGFWLHALMLLQRALTAILITLFIFAIRRRFKH
jgi:hypothetical protein